MMVKRFLMVKYVLLGTFMLLLSLQMVGQSRNIIGTHIPKKQQKLKKEIAKDPIAKLAKDITANSQTDTERVYAIYRWISSNIKYDNALRFDKRLQRKIYISEENVVANVLERKMAMCGGYAFLFRDLCETVNIRTQVIHGYTKTNTGQTTDYRKPNHSWNAVKLNGKWQLVDITWAVGFGSKQIPDDFWFLTPPRDFIYSHYPENSKWTLLQNGISFQEFKSGENHSK